MWWNCLHTILGLEHHMTIIPNASDQQNNNYFRREEFNSPSSPPGPQEKLQAGGFNDPLKGEFEVYQDKYLKPASLHYVCENCWFYRLLFFQLRERRKSASCCNATNWAGCSNWWQYSRFMTSWSCSAYFRSNFKHIYFVKDANYDMNENIPLLQILLHTICCRNPRKRGLNARESDWPTLSINEIVPR